jgi:SagB-type dehydrogenase family enzyme
VIKRATLLIALLSFNLLFAQKKEGKVKLPEPRYRSATSVEEALLKRRSVRSYKKEKLTLNELSQLLWSAQGITAQWGGRTCPSAGATYPLEIYIAVGEVSGLESGVYHYLPEEHAIEKVLNKDVRKELTEAAWSQEYILSAPLNIIIAADYKRTTRRYGERGIRYVHYEVGHCGQNIHLQCEALGLGTVVIGAFSDEKVKKILNIKEEPQYIMPVGRRK